jgi:hypothetical protein
LHRKAQLLGRKLLADQVVTGYADELSLEPGAEDSGIDVAVGAGQRPASERAINVDIAVGDDLRPRADRGGNDEIGAARIDLGPRPDRLGHQPGFDRYGGHGRCTRGRLAHRSPAWLRGIRGKAGEPGIGRRIELRRRRVLDADQTQRLAAQDLPRLGKLRRTSEFGGVLQVEHDRRVEKKPRTAPDLLGELELEGRIAQHARAHHHDGEDRALHEIARHPRTGPAPRSFAA